MRVLKFVLEGFIFSPGLYVLYLGIMAGLGLLVPILIHIQRLIIDTAIESRENLLYLLGPILAMYLLLYYFEATGQQISLTLFTKILHRVEKSTMGKFIKDVATISVPSLEHPDTQDTLMRVSTRQKEIHQKALNLIPNLIRRLIELGGVFIFVANAGVGWAFPLAIALSLPAFWFNKRRIELAREVWNKNSFGLRYSQYLNEVLLNREAAKERRFFRVYNYLSGLWDETFVKHNQRKLKTFLKSSVATGIAMCFSMSILLVLGLALLEPLGQGLISVGLYTALLIAILSRMNPGVTAIITELTNLMEVADYLLDEDKLSKLKRVNIQGSRRLNFESLVFDDVWFSYPGNDIPILQGVSFDIKKYQRHALIGVNGAGKTTLTKLMMGLYSPEKGTIYLNGRDIRCYDYADIRSIFALAQQNFARYKDSLWDNIGLYGLEGDTPERKGIYTLEKCQMTDLLEHCGGWQRVLSPEFTGGITLSGGQWQKISLARTLFANRDFIIFDEPTAALDPLAELIFYQTYQRIMDGISGLFITHRLGATYLFENCLVLSHGKIVEMGSHEKLMAEKGVYCRLYELQKQLYRKEA